MWHDNKGKGMRRLKKYLIGLGIFLVIFTGFGFFGLPPILKSVLIKQLSQNLHRDVTIREVKFNPYVLSLTVRDLLVKDRGGAQAFLSFEELYLNMQMMSVFRRAPVFKEITLKKPFINVVRNQDLSYNFSDLMEKKEPKPEPKPGEKPKPLRFSLNNIRIENGSIDFSDGPVQKKHTVRDLNIGIPFISNLPSYINTFVKPVFSAKINDTAYGLDGETKPFADSHETTFDININDLNIPYYLAYAPIKINFKIPSAFLDTRTKLTFIQYKDRAPSLTISGDVALKKIAVDDQKNLPIFRLPQLDIAIAPSEPLLKKIHLTKVSVQSPELEIRRDQKGTINIETLFPREKEAGGSPKKPAKPVEKGESPTPLSVDVDEVQLTGGKVSFSDLSRSKPFKTKLDPVEVKIDHFSNGKDKKTNYLVSLKTEANETVKLEGELSMDPMVVDGGVEVKSVPLKKYSPYYMDSILFDIEEGDLGVATNYRYLAREKSPEVVLSGMSISLERLRLKKRAEKEDFLAIPALSITNTGLNLGESELSIGDIITQKGTALVRRYKDGKLNLQTLVPEESSAKTAERPVVEGAIPAVQKDQQPKKPWLVKVGKVSLDQYTITWEDQSLAEPLTLTAGEIALKAENLSTAKGQKGNVSLGLRLDQKGTLSVAGPLGIDPLAAELKLGLKDIAIHSLQPYITDKVKIIVQDGYFGMNGNLSVRGEEGKEIQITYKGDSSITRFVSVDKTNAEDFLKWEALSLSEMDVGTNPLHVHVNSVALTNFYSRILIRPDGIMNVQDVMEGGEKTAGAKGSQEKGKQPLKEGPKKDTTPSKDQEAARDMKVGTITLQGGHINFTDNHIKPNYSADLLEIGGRISGLSSDETKGGDLDLRGKLGSGAPLEITGKINPLSKDLLVDLTIRLKDIELSAFTPYSGRYVGYTIEKGKLGMELKYLIVKRQLDSQNKIFLDQFTLGDKVESAEATKLPVKLAISLLKDRKGEINLDIPVKGSLDDPKFSVFSIILQVLGNLLVKAATSPFALLGAVFGGGQQLDYLEFDYGSAEIKKENEARVNTLIKVLQDRPGIKLDIEGHVDMEKDRDGLLDLTFQRKLKAQKLKEMVKKGLTPVPVDGVKLDPPEYDKYLKLAYKEEKFPKPKTILGFDKDIPSPEMEKLILTHIEIKEGDLRQLAIQRSAKVRDAMVNVGKIEPERIFVIEPKTLAPEKKEKLKDSRVDFKIK